MVDFHTGQDGVLQDLPRVWEGVPDPRKMVVDASWILEMRDQDTMLSNAGQYAKNGPAPLPPPVLCAVVAVGRRELLVGRHAQQFRRLLDDCFNRGGAAALLPSLLLQRRVHVADDRGDELVHVGAALAVPLHPSLGVLCLFFKQTCL